MLVFVRHRVTHPDAKRAIFSPLAFERRNPCNPSNDAVTHIFDNAARIPGIPALRSKVPLAPYYIVLYYIFNISTRPFSARRC
jgi:hypothetical protein